MGHYAIYHTNRQSSVWGGIYKPVCARIFSTLMEFELPENKEETSRPPWTAFLHFLPDRDLK